MSSGASASAALPPESQDGCFSHTRVAHRVGDSWCVIIHAVVGGLQ